MPETNESVFKNLNSDRNLRTAEEVVSRLREMIESGELAPGDRLLPERDLAKQLGVSRPTLRAGIRSLSAIGILQSRQGAGTFVAAADESPSLDPSALRLLSVLHRFTPDEISEAHLALAVSIAEFAALRAGSEDIAALAEEIAGVEASLDDPERFIGHERQFQKSIAAASGNRVLTALMNMVADVHDGAAEPPTDPKGSADMLQDVYRAIRDHDSETARDSIRVYLSKSRMSGE